MELLLSSEMVAKALSVAQSAHDGMVDKAGQPYIEHPIAVAKMLSTEKEQTAALLHDVVEDTAVTLDDLRNYGFPADVVAAVDLLTHRHGEPRKDYIYRLSLNELARTVKLADLAHNMDLSRIHEPTEKDLARTARYEKEKELLQDKNRED